MLAPARCFLVGPLAILALVTACRSSRPEPPPPPPLAIETDHFRGNVRSGPLVAQATEAGDTTLPEPASSPMEPDAWELDVRVAYARSLPPTGSPLTSLARHVVVERGSAPLRARAELSRGALAGAPASDLGPIAWETDRVAALLPGTTTVLRARPNDVVDDTPSPLWRALDVEVARPADAQAPVELALRFDGWVTPRPTDEEDEPDAVAEPPLPELRSERLLLTRAPQPGAPPIRLLFPAPAPGAPTGGFVWELAIDARPAPGGLAFATALDRARADLERGRELAAARAGPPAAGALELANESALHVLGRAELRRSSLVFLAQAGDAPFAERLALTADEATLAAFADALRDELRAVPASATPRRLGWELESAAYRWIATRAQEREGALPTEIEGLLLQGTGELGRYPDLLAETVAECRDVAQLEARLLSENRIFLEDAHPAARVRAYDWLAARGAEPGAYDPLGPREERRAALDALEESEATPEDEP